MRKGKDIRIARIERELSRLAALVSLAADDVSRAEKEMRAAAQKLVDVQQGMEQIYMTLEEPFVSIDMDE